MVKSHSSIGLCMPALRFVAESCLRVCSPSLCGLLSLVRGTVPHSALLGSSPLLLCVSRRVVCALCSPSRSFPMRRLLAIAAIAMLLIAAGGPAEARRTAAAAASAAVDQSVLDSAAQEINTQLALESDLNNANRVRSNEVAGVFSDSELAAVLERAEASAAKSAGQRTVEADAFAFLADKETPFAPAQQHESLQSILASTVSPVSADVEADLDTIATELDSMFTTKTEQARKALQNKLNKNKNRKAGAKKGAKRQSAYAPSSRQQKLISRLDSYRVSRGHAGADASLMETGSKQLPVWGYSAPSAYVAPAIAGAVAVPSPFQGQVATNQNALASALGLLAPAAPVAAAVATPNNAGVSVLLNALKRVQEEQETAALARQLSALLASQQAVAAAAAPVAVANPFTLQGLYGNLGVPQYLPGQTGVSPAYPSFIPADQASVTNEADQPNPFADHMP